MKRQIMKKVGSLLAAGLLVTGITTGATAFAATDAGATAALSASSYTVEEILVYAMEDEYLAQAEYNAIMNAFGTQKPFSNIVKSEATHISLLEPLFEEYNVAIPVKDWASLVTVPDTLEAAYAAGVNAEEMNIAMYESFLKESLPDDVKAVLEKLVQSSERHLAAFQRRLDGNVTVNGGNGNRGKNGQRGRNGMAGGGNGTGNGSALQGSCILN